MTIDGIIWNKKTYEAAQLLEGALSGDRNDKNKLFEALSTSDLPAALVPALNKKVLDAYMAEEVQWEAFAEREVADDFRPVSSAVYKFNSDGIPNVNGGVSYVDGTLPKIPELGEYPVIGVDGSTGMWSVYKSGAKFSLSWERIVNDRSLREIERAVAHLAKMARNSEEVAATSQFVTGGGINTATLTDGTSGSNDCTLASNTALTAASLEAAFKQASGHKIDGVSIRMPAKVNLIVHSSNEFTARRILGYTEEVTATHRGPNVLAGKFNIVVNDWFAELGGANGATTWAIAPAPGVVPNGGAAVGFLRGHENPRFFVRSTTNQNPEDGDFDLDAYETKIRHTAAPAWRGVNAGIVISNGSGS